MLIIYMHGTSSSYVRIFQLYLTSVNFETPYKYARNAILYSVCRKSGEELFDYIRDSRRQNIGIYICISSFLAQLGNRRLCLYQV